MKYGILFALYSPLALSAMSGWVNQQGCYVGKLNAPVSFVTKGNGSQAEKEAAADQLSYWNQYALIFNPISISSGTGQPSNGINELNTFISADDALSRYGIRLDPGTYGVALMEPESNFGNFNECKDFDSSGGSEQGGPFDEVDVLINADFASGWTTDTNDYSSPAWVQTTALHELGHAWGAHHVFSLPNFGDSFSVMNYVNDDVGMFVTRMDANTIRAAYPDQADDLLPDVGIFPFTYGNDQYASTYTTVSPTQANPGESIAIDHFLIQNIGSQSLQKVSIQFYLSTDQKIESSDILIGSVDFDTLPVNSESDLNINLNLPSNIAAGHYYIGAIATVNGLEDKISLNNSFIIGRPNRTLITIGDEPPPSGDNLIDDPGFEKGGIESAWISDSTNFGSVLCSIETCGGDGGTGPHNGDFWAWFGGITGEEWGKMEQNLTIPKSESAELSFYLAVTTANPVPSAYFRVLIDNRELFKITEQNAGQYPSYQQVKLDVSQFADGHSHKIYFEAWNSDSGGVINFMLDDVSLIASNNENNQCSGSEQVLSGLISGQYRCQVSQLIQTSGSTVIKSGADVELIAPQVQLHPLFKVEQGAKFKIK